LALRAPVSPRLLIVALACAGVLLGLLAPAGLGAREAASPPTGALPPASVTLGGGWQFRGDPRAVGTTQGWQSPKVSIGWSAVGVPSVFDARPLPELFTGTVGWYRVSFTTPPTPAGFSWALRFGQVRRQAQVWLNGHAVGTSADPYVPFSLPAGVLRAGASNTLVVRVDNRKGAEPREGWWNWGGITRPVELVAQGPVIDRNPALLPVLRCSAPERCTARVLFDGWLTNQSASPAHTSVQVNLSSPHGAVATALRQPTGVLAPGQTSRVRFSFPVSGTPELWAPGHPALYGARVSTLVGSQVTQVDTMSIGLRQVSVSGGRLLLNGRSIHLSGASIQEDVPGRGAALGSSDMDAIVSELRAVHANATRAQYGLDPRLLNRLDRAGILVWSQAPIYHRDDLLTTPAERQAALATLRGTVLQDRSHPSVITHSVANELSPTPDTTPGTRAYLLEARALAGDLDPTLPVSLDLLSLPGYPRQATYASFPLLGVNNYFGWYVGRAPHSTARLSDLAPYLRGLRRSYPGKAMVMTEFGAEATVDGPATVKQTFAFQSSYVRQTLDTVRRLGFVDGAIYWTLREFAVKPYWNGGANRNDLPRDSFHHKGLLRYDGTPKPAWDVARGEFGTTPLYGSSSAPSPGPSPLAVASAASASAVLVALLAALDVWLFAGIRRASVPRTRAPQPLRVRRDREVEHTYVGA